MVSLDESGSLLILYLISFKSMGRGSRWTIDCDSRMSSSGGWGSSRVRSTDFREWRSLFRILFVVSYRYGASGIASCFTGYDFKGNFYNIFLSLFPIIENWGFDYELRLLIFSLIMFPSLRTDDTADSLVCYLKAKFAFLLGLAWI